jgi:hypothetical protein
MSYGYLSTCPTESDGHSSSSVRQVRHLILFKQLLFHKAHHPHHRRFLEISFCSIHILWRLGVDTNHPDFSQTQPSQRPIASVLTPYLQTLSSQVIHPSLTSHIPLLITTASFHSNHYIPISLHTSTSPNPSSTYP